MVVDYWGLQFAPFRHVTGAGFFRSAASEEATARLQFLVENNHRVGVLVSDAGCGKTVLMQKFQRELQNSACDVCHLSLLGLDVDDLLLQLASELKLRESVSIADLWQGIFDRIRVNGYQDVPTVFLLDDAHEAESDVLRPNPAAGRPPA